jgi:endoglucanase
MKMSNVNLNRSRSRPAFAALVIALLLGACAPQPTALPTPAVSNATQLPATVAPRPSVPPPIVAAAPTVELVPSTNAEAQAVDPFVAAKALGRGVNFGNALESPKEGEWGMVLEEKFFDLVKEGGFQSIRLPVRWSAHALVDAPYTIDEAFFKRIDWAVENATKRKLSIVINMHHYEALMTATEPNRPRFAALWRQIANRYKDAPGTVLFELCNEPNGMPAGKWNTVLLEALAEVRKTNPGRNVVIGGVDWNSISKLSDLVLPESDKHIIGTFHYYSPHRFTHQGADWMEGSAAWLGTTWDKKSSRGAEIDFDFDRAAKWGQETGRPIWMGEFGSYSKADMASRELWTTYVRSEAERRGIAWAYWEFGAGFGVYDREAKAWVKEIKRSLVP